MRSALVAFGLLLVIGQAANLQQTSNVLQFVDGFVTGLEKNANAPDACASDIHILIQDGQNVVADVVAAINGNTSVFNQLMQDALALSEAIDSYNSACDFTELLADLANLTTANGIVDVIWAYVGNESTINSDIVVVQSCSNNLTACGQAVGKIVSLLIGYSI